MKTKFLLALALPLAFAACSNDEDLSIDNQARGEKLASKAVLTIDRGWDAETRLTENGWNSGDKVGLAWINNTSGVITGAQGDVLTDNNSTDANIYANHLFTYNDGVFSSEGDIYNGAYFAYYPFARQNATNGASTKTITLNGTQTVADSKTAFFNGAFSISTRDMITFDDVIDGTVEKQFALQQVANALVINTELGNKQTYTEEQIKGMKITGVTLFADKAGSKKPFYNTFTLAPQKLPRAVYNATTGAFENAKSLKAIVDNQALTVAAKEGLGYGNATAVESLSVNVADACNATLASANKGFVLFTLPTAAANVAIGDVKLVIRTVAGEVTIAYTDGAVTGSPAAVNNAAIEKLVALLSANGWKNESNKVFKLNRVENQRIGLNFQIDMKDFKSIEGDIKTAAEWNAAVKYFDTFRPNDTPTFNITGNVEFTKDELMTLPKKGLADVTTGAGSNTITFKSGDNTIGKKIAQCSVKMTIEKGASLTVAVAADKKPLLTLAASNEITVDKGAVLNVNGEIAGPATGTGATIKNSGTVNVGESGIISNKKEDAQNLIKVENQTGAGLNPTIVVGYNSYVHHNNTGVIKGIIDGKDDLGKNYYAYLVSRMTKSHANIGTADAPVQCNTIELKDLTVKEGDTSNTTAEGLPWADSGATIADDSFTGINVILNNSSLTSAYTTANKMVYATLTSVGTSSITGLFGNGSISVLSGTLTMNGVYTKKNNTPAEGGVTADGLYVEEGAKLVVDKMPISEPSLVNKGTVEVKETRAGRTTTMNVTDLTNSGAINVGAAAMIAYTGKYENRPGSTVSGAVMSGDDAEKIIKTMETAIKALNQSSYANIEIELAKTGELETAEIKAAKDALGAWYKACGTTAPTSYNAATLEAIAKATGADFGVNP